MPRSKEEGRTRFQESVSIQLRSFGRPAFLFLSLSYTIILISKEKKSFEDIFERIKFLLKKNIFIRDASNKKEEKL